MERGAFIGANYHGGVHLNNLLKNEKDEAYYFLVYQLITNVISKSGWVEGYDIQSMPENSLFCALQQNPFDKRTKIRH
jgi:hypothetical protein